MAIRRSKTGWQVDVQPGGRGHRRIRRSFETKGEALRCERWIKSQQDQGRPWEPNPRDQRRLSTLVERWYELHGISLKSGEQRRQKLFSIAKRLHDPVAGTFTAKDFTAYRRERLATGVSSSTANHEHAYLRALFRELRRLGEWEGDNPLAHVRQLRVEETELTWLTREEIARLFRALRRSRNRDALRVTRLALATGARWSEAEQLTASRLYRDRVQFGETKSGRVRFVPIHPRLARALRTRPTGRLFRSSYDAFRWAVDEAGLDLPRGQLTHVLRHTFASHFMQRGGSILVLQRILGHSTIQMTMRYAHLAPDHLSDALRFNPLAPRRHFVDTLVGSASNEHGKETLSN